MKDHYFKQADQKEFVAEGTNDELTKALETPEHPGRVRGQSQFTRWKDVFVPIRPEDVQLNNLKKEIDALKADFQKWIDRSLNAPAEKFDKLTEDSIQQVSSNYHKL